MNKHVKKISNYTMIGGMSALVIATLNGCGDGGVGQDPIQQPTEQQNMVKEGATVTIEEKPVGTFKIIDEVPSVATRVILRDENGTERILSQSEIDKLIKTEEAKIDAGTSNLTKSPEEVTDSGGGLSLGETLLASAAGAMLGAYIGNKLFGNQNYEQNRRTTYKSPTTYSRSQSSFAKAKADNVAAKSSAKKSGFFGNKQSSSSSSKSSSFGG